MIRLKKILNELPVLRVSGDTDRFIADIQYDSRKVKEGHAFVAIRGFETDGHRYIEQAYRNGARVFFAEEAPELPDATVVLWKDSRQGLARLSRIFFNFPDRRLKIIGITGTNGKTTTAYLIHSILQKAHWKPGLLSTIDYFDGKKWQEAERTTPESLDIQRAFSAMVRHGLKSAVMEVSSHALALRRVEGIPFTAGVFTNLSRDHLDFHKTTEDYFLAKCRLFESFNENQKAVLNADDPFGRRIEKITQGEVFTYSMHIPQATVKYLSHQNRAGGMQIRLQTPAGPLEVTSSLLGEFNIYNIMAAVATAVSLGIGGNFIAEGIRELAYVPGRCESYSTPNGATIYVDYAHTPDAIRKILKAVWETRPARLTVVFGAGGDRDRGKRPEMGKAAEDFADRIILTSDNPRSEDPQAILNDILAGIFDREKVMVIPDRREAILKALQDTGKFDAVVIAGKGHERYQEIDHQRLPFDDREVIRDFFRQNGWEFDLSRLKKKTA